jgi:hypothetical protein
MEGLWGSASENYFPVATGEAAVESIEKLDEVEAADVVVNRLGPERVVDSVKVELELDVLTSRNMVLRTSEKVEEIVWKADEFVTAQGGAGVRALGTSITWIWCGDWANGFKVVD